MEIMADQYSDQRLVIVSNRLPIVLSKQDDAWQVAPGAGGLISAIAPVLRDRGGVWIGWPGTTEADQVDLAPLLQEATVDAGYDLVPVELSAAEHDGFYLGFSNEIIWPLFHDLQTRCNFDPSYWRAYETVNRKFAQAVRAELREGDFLWIQDYHLMNVAQFLHEDGVDAHVGFFLHIPFPPPDIFLKLPWRSQVLRGLLAYDLIGFQTLRDRQNFVACLRVLAGDVRVRGTGQVITANVDGRTVRIGYFPISIGYQDFARDAAGDDVAVAAAAIERSLPDTALILGVDRLDYTKGIPERIKGFANALERYPDLRGKIVFTQVVVPSRTDIGEYSALKDEVEQLVSQVNGQFGQAGWVPIHYFYRALNRTELLAYYRTAAIALVTPLKDGMNLVAKEYCAANAGRGGVILSEFAGAAPQFQRDALLINPYDVDGIGDAIQRAVAMPPAERGARMRRLQRAIRNQDIFWWVDSFLRAAIAHDLAAFPVRAEHVMQHDEVAGR